MPAIISIIGTQNSGKTTLVEKLVAELTARGRRVATMKHAAYGTTFDQPGTDSWRARSSSIATRLCGISTPFAS